ncbi:phage terminase large subunit-like protein [Haloactinopolyspora alba]|uniref:Phage terminase large subunit-like protein n=1 Tax=Haloactinopolyspora alba TaxID=648780 RepID=A0A2P8E3T0_9ACTN|nr:terminase [Haloactinopolyspora alba]PSL04124.1 phage terminase large subunit-like protein [Haloactinopolyspora alba]
MTGPFGTPTPEPITPVTLGPTWEKNEDGSWRLPEYTLGWEIIGWVGQYLRTPEGGPWRYTPEQMRFILWWYALDERGVFAYRTGVLQRMKGWGKDPLLATMAIVEFVGPSRFSHWGPGGQPVARRVESAWVSIAAVSQSQTRNTMRLLPSLMSPELIAEFGIDVGKEILYAAGGHMLEAVTSSYRTLEGNRTTFTILNETHHWVSGVGGHDMMDVIEGNSTKMNARWLAITNAYMPGEDSVAERHRDAYVQVAEGRAVDTGFLYDTLEAPADAPLTAEVIPLVLRVVRGDATWLDIEAITKSILSLTQSLQRSRRMYYNQIVADEDAIYGEDQITPLLSKLLLQDGDEIVLGFDGSKSRDATALVGLRLSDRLVVPLGIWEKPLGEAGEGWEVDTEVVDSFVHEAHRRFRVRAFYADVEQWESYIDSWSRLYGESYAVRPSNKSAIGWDFRGSQQLVTRAHEALVSSIFNASLRIARSAKPLLGGHGDIGATLRRHILNARRRVNNYGLSFGKESKDSPKKVDGYAALMAAHQAEHDYHERGQKKPTGKRAGRVHFT